MQTAISFGWIFHFFVLGILLGTKARFFPRLKWPFALFAYLFVVHVTAGFWLKSDPKKVDPRSDAYLKKLQEAEMLSRPAFPAPR